MTYPEVLDIIKTAFAGVELEGGISMRQGESIDRREELEPWEFQRIPLEEQTRDWTAILWDELERFPHLAHLEAKGFRYYIPALMVALLERYENGSMRCISTLSGLRAGRESWDYHMSRYALLTASQKTGIAVFLAELPSLVALDWEDEAVVRKGLRDYWQEFLPD